MRYRHPKHWTVRVSECDEQDRSATFVIRFTPSTPDRGPDMNCAGGYPGDPEDYELLSIEDVEPGCDTGWILDNRWDSLQEGARMEADDQARDAMERAAEYAEEARRDAYLDRERP